VTKVAVILGAALHRLERCCHMSTVAAGKITKKNLAPIKKAISFKLGMNA